MANHRWEQLPGSNYHRTICIYCGTIRTRERTLGRYPTMVYEREGIVRAVTPLCDQTWPDRWRPERRYSMFLDDVRNPPVRQDTAWIVVRSVIEAIAYVERHGMPIYISFDHDLGEDAATGQDFADWLITRHLDGLDSFAKQFGFSVHSANPPGAANISGLLTSFLKFLAMERQNQE
jgi:hypothetical protein